MVQREAVEIAHDIVRGDAMNSLKYDEVTAVYCAVSTMSWHKHVFARDQHCMPA